jgi:uncharacterized membrane protein
MPLMTYLALYGITLLVMLPLDVLWLSTAGPTIYQKEIGALLLDKPALGPAAAFYLLYGVGVVFFAVAPAVRDGQWSTALLNGALFGFMAYATYDLSNLATLRGYTTTIALVDLTWGTVLTGVSSTLAFAVARYFRLG